MEHLITIEELRQLGRPISQQIDDEKLLSYIYETERLSIKPVLGDELFARVPKAAAEWEQGKIEEDMKKLLDGGEYTDCNGQYHIFSGLRMAMSYFVYAQYVMDGDFQLTRAGVVMKNSDYSSHVSSKERSDCYNNALAAAQGFLNETMGYVRFAFPDCYRQRRGNAGSPHNAITVKKIG